jgi:hypothetical protein
MSLSRAIAAAALTLWMTVATLGAEPQAREKVPIILDCDIDDAFALALASTTSSPRKLILALNASPPVAQVRLA